jgi:hypothetical protein
VKPGPLTLTHRFEALVSTDSCPPIEASMSRPHCPKSARLLGESLFSSDHFFFLHAFTLGWTSFIKSSFLSCQVTTTAAILDSTMTNQRRANASLQMGNADKLDGNKH